MRRVLLSALVALAALAGTTWLMSRPPASWHGTLLQPPLPARDFVLLAGDGPLALADLRGRHVVLFFGYTSCPDVCPTTLSRLAEAFRQAGGGIEREVQVVFVSVDPERDTPERASRYAAAFHPSFAGVTGTEEEVHAVASAYGIYYARVPLEGDAGYTVDHTATLTVLDPEGRVRLLWSSAVEPAGMAEDLRSLVGR